MQREHPAITTPSSSIATPGLLEIQLVRESGAGQDGDSNWHRYHTDPNAFIYSACQYQNRIYVSSLENHAYWLDGDQARPMPESTVATQFKTDGELLFGLGRGKFEVFDGTDWRMYELDLYKMFPKELEAMYAAAPGA